MTAKSILRIAGKRLHLIAQYRPVHTQIERRLANADTTILDQADRLKLELSRNFPALHDKPPVP